MTAAAPELGVDWWQLPGAAPLHATRATPGSDTEGRRIEVMAEALDTPLLPWQRHTVRVATERLPDGRYRYPVVVVSVPRQSGKTTLLRSVGVDRGLSRRDCGVFYTAQTGKDARERWQDAVKAIKDSPLATMATVRSAAGSERVVWPNGSTFRVFAPLPTSLHGYTPPLVMLDEAFAYDAQLGDDLMGAIGPAQITLPHRQLWIVSTAGTSRSTFLRRWIDAGLAGEPGVALFLWACPPGVDVYDPQLWPSWHPAMLPLADGRQLVTPEALTDEAHRLSRAEFERAYGNRWTRTASHHIAPEAWDRWADPDQTPPGQGSGAVFGWDVMHDRSSAAVTAVWREGERVRWHVVRSGPGDAWVPETLERLWEAGWRRFAHPTDGPARELAADWSHPATPVGTRELADSWGDLLRRVATGQLRHDGTDQLAVAVSNVATRPSLDTAAPSRRASAGDVTPVLAGLAAGVVAAAAPTPALEYRTG